MGTTSYWRYISCVGKRTSRRNSTCDATLSRVPIAGPNVRFGQQEALNSKKVVPDRERGTRQVHREGLACSALGGFILTRLPRLGVLRCLYHAQ